MEEYRVLETKKDYDDFLYKTPYLAFLDILGFSTLVRRNSHNELVDLYTSLFSKLADSVDEIHQKVAQRKAERLGEDYTDANLQIVNISDSILIWTSHGQPSALNEIVRTVSNLLTVSLIQGLPLRGTITRQPFTVINHRNATSIIGKGLVHAYKTEQIQQWSGCVIDHEIINYFRSIEEKLFDRKPISPLEINELVFEYEVPMKNVETKENYVKKEFAVNWYHPIITEDIITSAFEAHNKKDDRPGSDTPLKVNNTITFHRFCDQHMKEKEQFLMRFEDAMRKRKEDLDDNGRDK